MNTFFCSDHAREVGEDIISSATNYETYILVECPQPWAYDAFRSKWVPNNLQVLVEEVRRAKLPVRFLLIANNYSHKVDYTTLLIYQKQEGLSHGYRKYEFKLPHIEQVAGVVKKSLWHKIPEYEIETSITRDILVCTHGSHDQCCARYGSPFYFQASAMIADLELDNVRIWKSSHFGGHRFAPTAIDLPDGRYYGVLNQESFRSILTRTGDIQCLKKVYRGWGILPTSVQILERELMLRHGWNWFNYKVAGKIIEQSLDNNTILAELSVEEPSGSLFIYQAKLVKDKTRTLEIKGSCNAKDNSVFVKYAVDSIRLVCNKVATCSN
ncbi:MULTISPECIES: sucrase ferredoxin [unclassified Nodularia (in: cyanobacteria)]|uniref:sucrase ferredoxin n=1 Tax=unclassified Nodularia (in: cyanobacteria) TaxID=2656917 RepID=UPI00187F962E|nr:MULTISPECIES: sucrase ferredoxin [unclassified Nodularia (in: cyanobacteria)]MBE9199770.1 sucrase ferredoxin [Nodularia sp. LEGE 06071]MCC2696082.1 sucrase ferredoxin [Nodularia sp. LEGE 04288]